MVNKIKSLLQNYLIKGSLIILIGNLLASVINYLYHLFIGKLLSPSQYGILASFISLSYFTGVFGGALSLAIVNLISPLKNSLVLPAVKSVEKIFLKISLTAWIVALLLYPLIKEFLHLQSFGIYFVFSWQIFFSFLIIIYQATLQAKLKFFKFSILGIWSAVLRICLAVFFVFLGFQAAGALGGIVFSLLGTIILGRFFIYKQWQNKSTKTLKKFKFQNDFWKYSGLTLLTNTALISIYSSDVLLARYFFSSFKSGIYAATSVLGKIIFFASSSLILVAFPLFIKYKNDNKKLKKIFAYSLFIVLLIGTIGSIVYKLVPEFIINSLYNQSYIEAVSLLPSFALFISLAAVLTLIIHFLLAKESKLSLVVASLTALCQLILNLINHPTLMSLIINSTLSMIFGLLLGVFSVIKVINVSKK
ncbi:oligosaccharide flippase family protein [Patescibacteria group bacterium]